MYTERAFPAENWQAHLCTRIDLDTRTVLRSNDQPEWQNKQEYDAYPTVARISDRSISLKYGKA